MGQVEGAHEEIVQQLVMEIDFGTELDKVVNKLRITYGEEFKRLEQIVGQGGERGVRQDQNVSQRSVAILVQVSGSPAFGRGATERVVSTSLPYPTLSASPCAMGGGRYLAATFTAITFYILAVAAPDVEHVRFRGEFLNVTSNPNKTLDSVRWPLRLPLQPPPPAKAKPQLPLGWKETTCERLGCRDHRSTHEG